LSGAQTAAGLGSAELKLLSAGARSISPAAADQPFFYDARLKAAENAADNAAKVQPLSKALAGTPAPGDARIPLFKPPETIHSDEIALLSIDPFLRDLSLYYTSPD